jgi:hypothetical protein
MRVRNHLIVATLILGLVSSRARADQSGDGSATEAAERFDRGIQFFEEGNNAAALAEFQFANQLVPNAPTRLNIGLVYAAMGRPIEALDTLSPLVLPGSGLNPEQIERAKAAITQQTSRIGRIVVTSSVVGTRVQLDGLPVGVSPLPGPLRVGPGAHIVRAEADGWHSGEREAVVASSATITMHFELLPLTPEAPVPSVRTVEVVRNASSPGVDQRTWGWVSIAAGVLIAGASAGWLVANSHNKADAARAVDGVRTQRIQDTGICDISGGALASDCNAALAKADNDYSAAKSHDVFGFVGLGVGAAAIGLGVVLLLTVAGTDADRVTHSLWLRPMGRRGAVIALRF